MSLSKEIKVGLLVTITLIVVYLGFNYLKGKELFSANKIYYALYSDTKGLNTASEVMLNGVQVGKIRGIDMLPEEGYKIRVTLEINEYIKLTNTTIAKLVSSNLLGNKIIELQLKEGNLLQCHDTILSETEQDFQTMFAESTLPALHDARALTALTNKFMQNLVENTDRINSIFTNLEKTSEELRDAVNGNKKDLSKISRNMAEISSSLSDQEIGIRPLLTKLKELTHEIEVIKINDLTLKLNNILSKLEDGTFYGHIDQTIVDLDKLLIDFKNHPSRYVHFSVFGTNSIFNRNKHRIQPVNISK
jgi:phospholipid/cholesterol/gamma-HCH transport system substrate-binding protein